MYSALMRYDNVSAGTACPLSSRPSQESVVSTCANGSVPSAPFNLGNVLRETGDREAALAAYEEGLSLAHKTGSRRHMGFALNGLGMLALERGNLQESARRFAEALTIRHSLGERLEAAITLEEWARLAAAAGDPAAAVTLGAASETIHEAIASSRPEDGELHRALSAARRTLSPRWRSVKNLVLLVILAAALFGNLTLLILDPLALLTREEKIMGCTLAKAAGADYVKTSTGFAGGGATVEDVHLMRETVGPEMGVKASGGVRTKEEAEAMVKAGATRIGASAGIKIVRGEAAAGKGY